MSDKVFLGPMMAQLDTSPPLAAVSKVVVMVDAENAYVAGDDTGRTVEVTCPYGTQAMANNILAALQGYTYTPAQGQDALLDPAAELGDGITMGGVYTVLAKADTLWDAMMAGDVGAPGQAEQESEYSYQSPLVGQLRYQIAETRSLISKTADEIRLEVSNDIQELSASIDIQLDSITSTVQGQGSQISSIQQTVGSITTQITGINGEISSLEQTASSLKSQIQGLNGDISSIEQKVDSISLDVSNGTSSSRILLTVDGVQVSSATVRFTGDIVFESDLADGNTTVSGDCITTGEISARYIKLGGQMEVYESLRSSASVGGYIGFMNGASATGSSTDGIAITDYTERAMVICTNSGARMGYDDVSKVVCTRSQVSITGDTVYINGEPQSASDARLKTDVQYDVDDYLTVFDKLKPATFVYDGHKRRHMGFLAQEIQETLKEEGIPEEHFAALCTEVPNEERPMGMYSLRYGELQIMTVAKVQQMDKRLKELEAKLVG